MYKYREHTAPYLPVHAHTQTQGSQAGTGSNPLQGLHGNLSWAGARRLLGARQEPHNAPHTSHRCNVLGLAQGVHKQRVNGVGSDGLQGRQDSKHNHHHGPDTLGLHALDAAVHRPGHAAGKQQHLPREGGTAGDQWGRDKTLCQPPPWPPHGVATGDPE
jgi:hypothetical protein